MILKELELNYLSEQIEDLESQQVFTQNHLSSSKSDDDIKWYSDKLEQTETEIKYLNSILNYITEKELN